MPSPTPKQQRFADEYLIDLNATQAAIRAGYSRKTAKAQGSRLLTHPAVKGMIDERMAARAARTRITQDYVIEAIRDTVERCRQAEPVVDRSGKETGEYRFDPANVLKGCDLLGKHLGMFKGVPEEPEAPPPPPVQPGNMPVEAFRELVRVLMKEV
jgi:phage terminase small subunit